MDDSVQLVSAPEAPRSQSTQDPGDAGFKVQPSGFPKCYSGNPGAADPE